MIPDFDFALGETAAIIRDTTRRFAGRIDAEGWSPQELWPPMGAGRSLQGADPPETRGRGRSLSATPRLRDDGIVDPVQTCDVLGLAVAATLNAPAPKHPRFGPFRM